MATPEESRIVGSFGEYVLGYYLTKKGVSVLRADTVFFDLIVRDTRKTIFPEGTSIGISVKFRDRTQSTPTCTIPHKDFPRIQSYADKWGLVPYFCHIISFRDNRRKIRIQAFIFPLGKARQYFAKGKRKYAISFSILRRSIGKYFKRNENYFEWLLD